MSTSKTAKRLGRLGAALFISASAAAHAGDPCPIDFGIYDLGSPHGLDHQAILAGLQTQQASLGITYRYVAGGMRIDSLHPDGPFATAGLAPRMVITSLQGVSTEDNALSEAVLDGLTPGDTLIVEAARYGTPSSTYQVEVTARDPLPIAAIAALQAADCREAALRETTDQIAGDLRNLMAADVDQMHCGDAHLRIVEANIEVASDALLFLRTQSEVMITLPGWETICLPAAELDGDLLTQETMRAALDRVIWEYVGERFSTP